MKRKKTTWNSIFKKQRNNQKKKSHVPKRLDFLFFIVFLLFSVLIVRLADLQINQKDKFTKIIESGQKSIVLEGAPRGEIYDSKGKLLVKNTPKQAVVFTRSPGMTAQNIREASEKVVDLITIKPEKLTERDIKDYWLSDKDNFENVAKQLTTADKLNKHGERLSESAMYSKIVNKVKIDDIQLNEIDKKRASVFKRINAAAALQPVIIKNDGVTTEEIAKVGENTAAIPGISTGLDWDRDYPEKDQIRTILGVVSSEKQGLPEEQLDEYLEKGYARNDRVGLSYLEKSYEDALRGKKGESEVVIDKNQQIVSKKETKPSEKGDNLVLTLDLAFQKQVEDITKKHYQSLISAGKANYSEGAYVVVTEPQTGNILAMVGLRQDEETGELVDDALGTFNKAFVPGSSIKAATVMAGYENGVISGNQKMIDEPLVFNGGLVKSSLFNQYGAYSLSTEQALEVSSNVYMMKIALKMIGVEYQPNLSLPYDVELFGKLRKTYEEFGLGSETGIDLPGELTGFINTKYKDKNGNYIPGIMGNALDLSFGNYDTYTAMQLNQYVATIANNGIRVAPHIVKGVYDTDETGELGKAKEELQPKIMNKIEGRQSEFDIIHNGMVGVVNGPMGTGHALQGASYPIAAKTGTAETAAVGPRNNKVINLVNSSIVGYAPYNQPKIAVSVVLPHLTDDLYGANAAILRDVVNSYAALNQK
ncbi:peptidoglycan D,D-transpeptidase FtsI family protein [Vagococcus sp.]|uniref:peptidoglycan D,D-transpeptidase FtsI family protein n=1 Tax=Vagococcus sp. TaxID=1933889 RepID=UPI003F95EA62